MGGLILPHLHGAERALACSQQELGTIRGIAMGVKDSVPFLQPLQGFWL